MQSFRKVHLSIADYTDYMFNNKNLIQYYKNAPEDNTPKKEKHEQNKNLKQYPENVSNTYQQVPFYSPKYTEQKKISQFFSPNKLGGNHYPFQHSYGYGGHHY